MASDREGEAKQASISSSRRRCSGCDDMFGRSFSNAPSVLYLKKRRLTYLAVHVGDQTLRAIAKADPSGCIAAFDLPHFEFTGGNGRGITRLQVFVCYSHVLIPISCLFGISAGG